MKFILYCQLKLGSMKNLRSLTQMDLYYGKSGTSDPTVEALGVQLATLGRASLSMPGFIKKTLTTGIFGLRLHTLMIKKPTQQFVNFPLLILTSIRKKIQIKIVLTMVQRMILLPYTTPIIIRIGHGLFAKLRTSQMYGVINDLQKLADQFH